MKIRTRIVLFYTLITASLIILFGVIIYWNAASNREKAFFNLLQREAVTKANLYFHTQVDEATLQKIYLNNRELIDEVEVAIYQAPFNLIYHDAVEIDVVQETAEMITAVLEKGMLRFYQDDWQVTGVLYEYKSEQYIVFAAAQDVYGMSKLAALRNNMVLVFLLGIIVLYFAGVFIAKKAFDPIKEMTIQANKISAANLNLRLNVSQSKDELMDLSKTFNSMLDRLESSFEAQKDFVSNIAHEIRTPLSAIIGELDLAMNQLKENDPSYKVIQETLSDAKRLSKIVTSLLDLAKTNYNPQNISFKAIRIDDLLVDAYSDVQKSNPNYKTDIQFENANEIDWDAYLQIKGNEYLLKLAFVNLIENACKYSSNQKCFIKIENPISLTISFIDEGIGIPKQDLERITEPFYRGSNLNEKMGAGIGLSLVDKIVRLHHADLEIVSEVDKGTKVSMKF